MRTIVIAAACVLSLSCGAGCGDDLPACFGSTSTSTGGGAPPAGPTAASYQISLTMSQPTVEALSTSGDFLYVLKAVSASDEAGVPLVWVQTQHYSLHTLVAWQEEYEAYTAFPPIPASGPVSVGASYPIAPGERLEVQSSQGIGAVEGGGVAGSIEIDNQTTSPFTTGISQPHQVGGGQDATSPVCAFPLHGSSTELIAPLGRVLLMFATGAIAPGTPMATSPNTAILVDFGDTAAMALSYDINEGWSAESGGGGAQAIPSNTDLQPLLIVPP